MHTYGMGLWTTCNTKIVMFGLLFLFGNSCAGGNRCCGIISLHLDIWISNERQGLHGICRWSPQPWNSDLSWMGWEGVWNKEAGIAQNCIAWPTYIATKEMAVTVLFATCISVSSALICVVDPPVSAAYCWMLMNAGNQLLCGGFLLIFSCPPLCRHIQSK